MDVNGAEAFVVMTLLGLVPAALGLLLFYFVVRLGVRHGVRDALKDRDQRRQVEWADRVLGDG